MKFESPEAKAEQARYAKRNRWADAIMGLTIVAISFLAYLAFMDTDIEKVRMVALILVLNVLLWLLAAHRASRRGDDNWFSCVEANAQCERLLDLNDELLKLLNELTDKERVHDARHRSHDS